MPKINIEVFDANVQKRFAIDLPTECKSYGLWISIYVKGVSVNCAANRRTIPIRQNEPVYESHDGKTAAL